ncbi:unnamed protein product, partial [Prorocentrum cordatum]
REEMAAKMPVDGGSAPYVGCVAWSYGAGTAGADSDVPPADTSAAEAPEQETGRWPRRAWTPPPTGPPTQPLEGTGRTRRTCHACRHGGSWTPRSRPRRRIWPRVGGYPGCALTSRRRGRRTAAADAATARVARQQRQAWVPQLETSHDSQGGMATLVWRGSPCLSAEAGGLARRFGGIPAEPPSTAGSSATAGDVLQIVSSDVAVYVRSSASAPNP